LAVLATDLHEQALKGYQTLYERLSARGVPRKQAREVARTVLPGGTETRFFVTGNIRTWREIIQKRSDPGADREIQQFANEIRKHLRELAPNSTWDL
jgi:thymidylate synthase (FAD)